MDTPDIAQELRRAMPGPHEREPANLRRDIEDELADHLALATQRELARGLDQKQARKAAIDRFGSPGHIARKLWFDAMKEHIMRDRLIVAVNILLAVVVILAAVMIWRISEQSRQNNLALVAALDKIASGKAAAAPAVNNMASLSVQCVKNTAGNPPADLAVTIFGKPFADSDKLQYTQNVDNTGLTKFGPMLPGSYHLSATLKSDNPNMIVSKTVLLYAGDQRDEKLVQPIVPQTQVTASMMVPEDLRDSPLLVACQIEYTPETVGGDKWYFQSYPIAISPAGKLYSNNFGGGNISIGPNMEIKNMPMWARDFRLYSMKLYRKLDQKSEDNLDEYLLVKEVEYRDSNGPLFHLDANPSNHVQLQLPDDFIKKMREEAAIARSGLKTGSVDPDLFSLAPGAIKRIFPIDKDCMVLSYVPTWNNGDVDNIAIANNDGGVRTLLHWPAISAFNPKAKYHLAMYVRTSTNMFKDPAQLKGAIVANVITEDWNEKSSWEQMPKHEQQPMATFDFAPGPGWKFFDVTPIVRSSAESQKPWQGIMLHFADESKSGEKRDWSGYQFVSREGAITKDGDTRGDWSEMHPMLLEVE